MNCCLTKQKLLIELMHLRVVIDLAMSLPDGERRWGGCVCGWEEGSGGPVQLREAEQKKNKAAGRWREKIGKQDGESRCEMYRD